MSGEVDRRLAGGETDEDADQVSVDEDAPVRMTDAEERFAMRLAEDLERVLGAGIGIADLEISGDGPVHVRAALLAEGNDRGGRGDRRDEPRRIPGPRAGSR
jgi:hypothetical protein